MASIIDPTLAKSLIKEFHQHNSSVGGPALKTPWKGTFSMVFLSTRKSLENVLKASQERWYTYYMDLAKHPDFAGKT